MEDRILSFVVPLLGRYGYVVLFGLTFLETSAFLGLVAPGETIIVLCGFAAFRGVLDAWTVAALAAAGGFLGDQLGYLLGRTYGHGFVERFGRYVLFDRKKLRATQRFYGRHGGKTVFIGRWASLLRSFGPVVAGASHMSYPRFAVASALSVVPWAATFTLVGYYFGASWELIERYLGWGGVVAFVAAFVAVLWYLHRKSERIWEEESGGGGGVTAVAADEHTKGDR